MPYKIKALQRQKAKSLGVTIKSSSNPKKKLDVYIKDENGKKKKVASIGASGYMDYASYIQEKSQEVADKRRNSYRARHKGEEQKRNSPGFYAWHILW